MIQYDQTDGSISNAKKLTSQENIPGGYLIPRREPAGYSFVCKSS
jgi:hypothetical protein